MNCKHPPFEFGSMYMMKGLEGSCDSCGCSYSLEGVVLRYTGDSVNGYHTFDVINPFRCSGCHAYVREYQYQWKPTE